MTKQQTLTNFPTTICATAKRRAQAQIRKAKEELFSHSLTGYMTLFEEVLPCDFMEGVDSTQRQRNYGFLPTFWAWTGQIIQGNHSCTLAVSLIQSWCRALKLPIPSSDNSAYCRARRRLTPEALTAISQRIAQHLDRGLQHKDLWKGHQLLSIDGTSIRLMDTEENQKAYPQPSVQKKGCGFPVMGVAAVANHSHGGIVDVFKCGHQNDARIAPKLLHTLREGDIMLGDRAFCTYEFTSRIRSEICDAPTPSPSPQT